MKRLRAGLALAVIQVIVSAILLNIGRQQLPRTVQDYPVFVGSAIKISEAINAPVFLLEGSVVRVFHWVGFGVGLETMWNVLYLVGVFFLWFLSGLEIQSRLQKKPLRRRAALDCLIVASGIVLACAAFVAWQEDERTIAVGFATWALILVAIYGAALLRIATRRRVPQ